MTLLGHGPHIGPRATDLLDGRLSGAEEVALRQHIGGCRDCARAVHREQQVRGALRAAGTVQPRPTRDLMAGLLALPDVHRSGPFAAAWGPDRGVGDVPRPSTRLGSSVLMGAAVLGTVSLASAGVLGSPALPGPGTAAVRWGEAASSSLSTTTTPAVQSAGSFVRTGVGAVVLTGAGIDRGAVRGAP